MTSLAAGLYACLLPRILVSAISMLGYMLGSVNPLLNANKVSVFPPLAEQFVGTRCTGRRFRSGDRYVIDHDVSLVSK